MIEPNINDLYRLVRNGDAAKEKHLFKLLHEKFLYFTLHRVWDKADAEEIVQETLMTIHREHAKVEFTVSFAAWAYKVLNNRILDYINVKRRRASIMKQAVRDNSIPRPAPPAGNPELKHRLLFCLEKISRSNIRYARILNLHYQGYSTTEICEKTRLTQSVFYMSLFRARIALISCLEKEDVDR